MIDANTGEIVPVQILVAVLGASSFTYAEAVWSQKLPNWIAAHVRAFAYFGGGAQQTVSNNLKAGITKASFHEPMVNRTYADMARHYRTAIVPARPYKPRDKAKVEVGVQVVGRWILTRLRHRRFFSLFDLNAATRALLTDLGASNHDFLQVSGTGNLSAGKSMTHIATFGCIVLPSRRVSSLTLARNSHARALSRVVSKSLARRRLRLSQAKVRSTTQRRGSTTNPAASERLTISIVHRPILSRAVSSLVPR